MMTESQPPHLNFLFRLLIPVCGLFVVTLMAMVATLFGDPAAAASPAHRLLDRYAGTALLVEVCAIVVVAVLAMVVDRRQTIRSQRSIGSGNVATTVLPDAAVASREANDAQAFAPQSARNSATTGS